MKTIGDTALAESVWGAWGSNKDLRHEFAWRWLGWNLSRQVVEMRKDRGWTQRELSRRSGLTTQTIIKYEKSCCGATIRGLLALARAFDVALVCRFGTFSEMLVIMADGSVIVPREFDKDLEAMRLPAEVP